MLVRQLLTHLDYSGAQFTLATISLLLPKLDQLTFLKLFDFPPFQDPELQKAYGKYYRKECGVSLCFLFFGWGGPRLSSYSLHSKLIKLGSIAFRRAQRKGRELDEQQCLLGLRNSGTAELPERVARGSHSRIFLDQFRSWGLKVAAILLERDKMNVFID